MIKSMTGYGKAEAILSNGKICVEIRSLNGKNADISIKTSLLPKEKEIAVRQLIASELQRGNIDMFVTFESNADSCARTINSELALNYFKQLSDLSEKVCEEFPKGGAIDNTAILGNVLRIPDVIGTNNQDVINGDNWDKVEACIADSLREINEFRSKEGAVLYRDVTSKVSNILSYVDEVEKLEKERIDNIRERITSKLEELKADPDPARLEQEMIYYIEKLDINEEKVRLRQHCRYFMETIDTDPFPGKKLGFIAQEMGREINTTGSKANHVGIQKIVVKMKDELEKIKEQSLNIL